MLVLVLERVSSRVPGFPVASPCVWGKPQNLSFSKVAKQVVMSFCVARVALCDIPTCFIPCRKCQNWRKARTKCSFCCSHLARLGSLVGRRGTLWQSNMFYTVSKVPKLEEVSHEMLVLLLPVVSSRVSGFPVASSCLWGKPRTTLHTPHSTLLTPHFTLHTPHFTLHTPQFTL